jgi:hypothetical protein
MKKLTYRTALVLVFSSCKKETKEPTPAPAGPCHCGEILQTNFAESELTAKNYCSGNTLTFYVGGWWFVNPTEDYCQTLAW